MKPDAPARRTRRRPRGVLPVIAALLLGSAAVRVLGDAGPAFAVGSAEAEAEAEAPDPALGPCEAAEAPAELLAALRAREDRVAEQEAQIADRMQALRLAEAEIDEKLAALTEAEESLAATIGTAREAAEGDIGRLTLVYENMPPTEVAALFEEMDPAFSSGFLARMAPEAAAAVMSNLTPATAYQISVVIAGRNAGAPTE